MLYLIQVLKMELKSIKGIGPKTIDHLNKLGITTIEELLSYYPPEFCS